MSIRPFSIALCTLPFIALFILGPLRQLSFLADVPGDFGDGRLNAYFLEHVWQVVIGRAESFIHMPFFSPTLWVGAFSDLHWGSAIVYVSARSVGLDSITSYQLWWLFAYAVNYASAFVAFRILRFDSVPSIFAALFFTFALPVAAHTYAHSQLSYRFGAPLAFAFYIRFLLDGDARRFLWALFFTVWQIYATIYVGFFTLIGLLFITLGHFRFFVVPGARLRALARPALQSFVQGTGPRRTIYWGMVFGLLVMFVLAFVPYLIPSDVYGDGRSRSEIFSMLPRVASYFYTNSSAIWMMEGRVFANIPMLHEHQMFIGLAGLVMVLWGALMCHRHDHNEIARLLWVPLVAIVLVTLNSDGVSLWRIFSDLPLASAIRAMTRIDLVLLFFASGLIAVLVQQATRRGFIARSAIAVAAILLAVEAMHVRTPTTSAASARQMESVDVASAQEGLTDGSLLFVSQSHNDHIFGELPWYAMEIRAMWVGSILGVPVINGYSGKSPEGYNVLFGEACSEAGKRLAIAYQLWPELQSRAGPLEDLFSNVHLVAFPDDCDLERVALGARSLPRTAPLPRAMAENIELRLINREQDSLVIEIINNGPDDLVPESHGTDDVNLAFRWHNSQAITGDGYARIPLPVVVLANGRLRMRVPVSVENMREHGDLEITLVQEGHFWFHDAGMATLQVSQP